LKVLIVKAPKKLKGFKERVKFRVEYPFKMEILAAMKRGYKEIKQKKR
jgi:hypothetical protein